MKYRVITFPRLSIILTVLLSVTACYTPPDEIPEGLSQMEFFQRAQTAADQGRYETALLYYNELLERFPDDRSAQIEARYEIAFIAYKQGEYEEAQMLFENILAEYEADQGRGLPEWPRVLSLRLLATIDERLHG